MSDNAQPPSRAQIIHEIIWSEAFPWWILLKAAGMAFAPTVIILATLASAGTWAGFSLLDSLGVPEGLTAHAKQNALAAPEQEKINNVLPLPNRRVSPPVSMQVDRLSDPPRNLFSLLYTPFG
ncbi:MAG: hypothetical protein MPJ22_09785, partial [Pirellulales bacterium]|nr:hypothetical protein [Pirellulales bacterium]